MNEFRSLADLLDLQHIDSEIDRLLETRASLPELEMYRRAHVRSETVRLELADKQQTLREVTGPLGGRFNGFQFFVIGMTGIFS